MTILTLVFSTISLNHFLHVAFRCDTINQNLRNCYQFTSALCFLSSNLSQNSRIFDISRNDSEMLRRQVDSRRCFALCITSYFSSRTRVYFEILQDSNYCSSWQTCRSCRQISSIDRLSHSARDIEFLSSSDFSEHRVSIHVICRWRQHIECSFESWMSSFLLSATWCEIFRKSNEINSCASLLKKYYFQVILVFLFFLFLFVLIRRFFLYSFFFFVVYTVLKLDRNLIFLLYTNQHMFIESVVDSR